MACPLPVGTRSTVRVSAATPSRSSGSGLSSAGESVAVARTVPFAPGSMLPWALDRPVPMPAAHEAPGGLGPPASRRGSSFAARPFPPESGGRARSRLVWLRVPDAAPRPEGQEHAGRLAGSPKTATLPVRPHPPRRRAGIGRLRQPVPKDDPAPRASWGTPKGSAATAHRGTHPRERSPCRPVSPEGARSPAHRRRSEEQPRPSARPRRAATGVRACREVPGCAHPKVHLPEPGPLVVARAPARKQGPLRRATRVAPWMRCSIRTHPLGPEGPRRKASWHSPPKEEAPAHGSDRRQRAGATGLGPDRHRLHRDGRDRSPPAPEGAGQVQAPGAQLWLRDPLVEGVP
jgi:hypothetical protein